MKSKFYISIFHLGMAAEIGTFETFFVPIAGDYISHTGWPHLLVVKRQFHTIDGYQKRVSVTLHVRTAES